MESSSAPAHRQLVPWQELLLAGSLLIFWSLPVTQQLILNDLAAAEGKDVLFSATEIPPDIAGFRWFKGERTDDENFLIGTYIISGNKTKSGPANNTRQIICSNGSLLFLKITYDEEGPYTLQVIKSTLMIVKATAQVRVYPELSAPTLTTDTTTPEEGKTVAFKCEPVTANTTYRWLIDNQTHPNTSKYQNGLTLAPVSRKDSGIYQCEARNPVSVVYSNKVTLNVLYGPDAPTITPTDFQYYPGANLSLSCKADSNPPAELSWIVNGKTLQRTADLFIPKVTAKDSGTYTCLAHNPATGRDRTSVQNISVSMLSDDGIMGLVIGFLVVLAVITGLVCVLFGRTRG